MSETIDRAPSFSGLADEGMIGPQRVPYIDYLPDNSDEVLGAHPVMAARCVDCAYTVGTSANAHPMTSRMAQECADARCAFWCHKTREANDFPTHLCAGWLEAIERSDDPSEAAHETARHLNQPSEGVKTNG